MTQKSEDSNEERIQLLEQLLESLQGETRNRTRTNRFTDNNMGTTVFANDRRRSPIPMIILVFLGVQMLMVVVDGLTRLQDNANKLEELTELVKVQAISSNNTIKAIDILELSVVQNTYRIEDNAEAIYALKDK